MVFQFHYLSLRPNEWIETDLASVLQDTVKHCMVGERTLQTESYTASPCPDQEIRARARVESTEINPTVYLIDLSQGINPSPTLAFDNRP